MGSNTRRRRLFDLLGLLLVLGWALVFGWRQLGQSPDSVESGLRTEGQAGLTPGDEWHGLFRGSERVGYLHLRKEALAGGRGWRVRSELRMTLLVLGTTHALKVDLEGRLAPDLTLQEFTARLAGGNTGTLDARGTVSGRTVQLSLDTGSGARTRTIELPRPPTLELTARPLLATQGLKVGKKLSVEYFDPLSQAPRQLQATVIGEEDLVVLGQVVHCFVLRQEVQGMQLQAWVTAGGDAVKEELPLGLVALRMTEEEARYGRPGAGPAPTTGRGGGAPGGRALRDLVDASAVPVRGALELLGAPRVRLRLLGLGLAPAARAGVAATDAPPADLHGGRQQLIGDELLVEEETLPTPSAQASIQADPRTQADPAVHAALAPELLLQSDDPALRRVAAEVTAGAADPLARVEKLVHWVHGALAKESVVGVPSALDVLRQRKGDCTEHAALFVALARAAGVPARLLAGAAYLPDRQHFYYHAWAEAWLAGRWVEVDPTFDQLPASAARIRMVRGGLDRQIELFRFLGRLEGIEVRPWTLPASPATHKEASP